MSSISGMGSSYFNEIASGNKISKATDGAAELAIANKRESELRGIDAGTRNAEDGKSVLKVADGALSSINDNLQRMRELAVKASNTAVVSDSDRKVIQKEIEQLKQGISDIAENTQFNTKNLLDGSNEEMHIATNSDGSGTDIKFGDATLEALGIKDFDVTKDFSIKTLDKAISKVAEDRSSIGAQSNSLDYMIGYNTHTSYNLNAALNNSQTTDIAETATKLKEEQVMQTYRLMVQKKQMENEQQKLSMFYM